MRIHLFLCFFLGGGGGGGGGGTVWVVSEIFMPMLMRAEDGSATRRIHHI